MNKQLNPRRWLRLSLLQMLTGILIVSVTLAASSANYAINWQQSGAGGAEGATSASYRLDTTIGQPAAGPASSASYNVQMGYRSVEVNASPTPIGTLPEATNTPTNTPTNSPTETPGGPTDTPTSTPRPIITTTPTPVVTGTPPTDTPTFTPRPSDTPSSQTPTPRASDTPRITNTPTAGTPTVTPTDCPNPFTDITGDIFYGAIHSLYCRGVVNGVDSTHFNPHGTSTRAQFAKVVVLGFGIPLYTPTVPDFSDVPSDYYAYVFIETGFHNGVLNGFDAATCAALGATFPCYGPGVSITRGQLTKLVVNAGHYPLFTPTSGQTFSDVGPSNVFYVSIETAHQFGVINGYSDGTFKPNQNISRDQMCQIVYEGVLNQP